MKKYVTELSNDELLMVFNANSQLQNEVLDDMIENEMSWIADKLDYIRGSLKDYSVGLSSHIYLEVRSGDEIAFLEGVKGMQKDYGVLSDDDASLIEEVEKKIEEFQDAEMYSDEYYELEEDMENSIEELEVLIASQFKRDLNSVFDRTYQEEHFISFYASERLDSNCYIETDDDDYILYEDVSYTKKYN